MPATSAATTSATSSQTHQVLDSSELVAAGLAAAPGGTVVDVAVDVEVAGAVVDAEGGTTTVTGGVVAGGVVAGLVGGVVGGGLVLGGVVRGGTVGGGVVGAGSAVLGGVVRGGRVGRAGRVEVDGRSAASVVDVSRGTCHARTRDVGATDRGRAAVRRARAAGAATGSCHGRAEEHTSQAAHHRTAGCGDAPARDHSQFASASSMPS